MLASAAATGLGLRRIGSGMTGISTPDVEVVRRAYAALAAGDMEELEQCFARDAVWHEPGSNIYSGVRVGWPEIQDEFLALLGPLSHGTLRTELVDIAASEKYVVSIVQRVSTTA
jgi:ketosteroid isomerase-like protein